RLGDCPDVGRTHAKRRSNQYHKYRSESGTNKNARNHKDGGTGHSNARESLSHESWSRPGDNPSVGKTAAGGSHGGANNVSRSHDGRHLVHGETSAANQISRHPGKEEVGQIVQASQSGAGAPGGPQFQDFDNPRTFLVAIATRRVFVAWHPPEPGQKPSQAEETKHEEKRPPAKPAARPVAAVATDHRKKPPASIHLTST